MLVNIQIEAGLEQTKVVPIRHVVKLICIFASANCFYDVAHNHKNQKHINLIDGNYLFFFLLGTAKANICLCICAV